MATENPRVWFKSISLENVRSFGTKQTINFTDKDGNAARWNVILGDNGTGKTTVLRSLALIFGRTGLDLRFLFRDIKKEANTLITLEKDNSSIATLIQDYKWYSRENDVKNGVVMSHMNSSEDRSFEDGKPIPAMLVRAYGANRRIGNLGISNDQVNYFTSLFDENVPIINAEEWLIQTDYIDYKNQEAEKRFYVVSSMLSQLFRNEVFDIFIKVDAGIPKVFFRTHYGDVRLHELSLGYKTLIAWMVDFAKGLLDRYPDSPDPLAEPAVCLVDELDLHLHPKFQRNIIQFLTETFPNTQFIVTAHSPLIVQSAEDANIILLKREGNETHVMEGIDVHSWRIDQILSSDLFGGISSRAPQVEEKMSRRRSLLRKDGRSPDEQHELNDLEKELGELPVMETREALKAIDIISKAVISEGQP